MRGEVRPGERGATSEGRPNHTGLGNDQIEPRLEEEGREESKGLKTLGVEEDRGTCPIWSMRR